MKAELHWTADGDDGGPTPQVKLIPEGENDIITLHSLWGHEKVSITCELWRELMTSAEQEAP